MRNDLEVAIASTDAEERQKGKHTHMTDTTSELSAGESVGLDGKARGKVLREQTIRERAYVIWEEAGHPHGKDLDNWLSAEQQVGGKDPDA